jgi:hypothetical protein
MAQAAKSLRSVSATYYKPRGPASQERDEEDLGNAARIILGHQMIDDDEDESQPLPSYLAIASPSPLADPSTHIYKVCLTTHKLNDICFIHFFVRDPFFEIHFF